MRTSGGYWLRAEDPLRPPPGITEAAHDRLVSGGGTRGEGGSRPLAPGVCRGLEELRRRADRRPVLGRRAVPVPPLRRAGAGPGGSGAVVAGRGLASRRLGPGQAGYLRRRLPGRRGRRGRRGGHRHQRLPIRPGWAGGGGLRQLLRDAVRLRGPVPRVHRVVRAAAARLASWSERAALRRPVPLPVPFMWGTAWARGCTGARTGWSTGTCCR